MPQLHEGKSQPLRAEPVHQRRRVALDALDARADGCIEANLRRFFGGIIAGRWHAIDVFRSVGRQITVWGRSTEDQAIKHRLSSRELQVAQGVIQGEPNKVIAADLGVSETTVSSHLHAVLAKLGLRNRSMLVACIPLHALQAPYEPPRTDGAERGQATTRAVAFSWRSDSLVALSIEHRRAEPSTRLTASEQSVATLLAAGLSYRDIADARGSSPNTIKNQSSTIYRKLGVHSRFELTSLWCGTRVGRANEGHRGPEDASSRMAPTIH